MTAKYKLWPKSVDETVMSTADEEMFESLFDKLVSFSSMKHTLLAKRERTVAIFAPGSGPARGRLAVALCVHTWSFLGLHVCLHTSFQNRKFSLLQKFECPLGSWRSKHCWCIGGKYSKVDLQSL